MTSSPCVALSMCHFSIRPLYGGIVVFLHSFTRQITTASFDRLRFMVAGITSSPIMIILALISNIAPTDFKKSNPTMNGSVLSMTDTSTG